MLGGSQNRGETRVAFSTNFELASGLQSKEPMVLWNLLFCSGRRFFQEPPMKIAYEGRYSEHKYLNKLNYF